MVFICFEDRHADVDVTWCLFVSRIAMPMKTLHDVYLLNCFWDRHADVDVTWCLIVYVFF